MSRFYGSLCILGSNKYIESHRNGAKTSIFFAQMAELIV